MKFEHCRIKAIPHIRRSHERANSSPPPKAAPSITAIVGMGSACLYKQKCKYYEHTRKNNMPNEGL
jgi:hypothetical protein